MKSKYGIQEFQSCIKHSYMGISQADGEKNSFHLELLFNAMTRTDGPLYRSEIFSTHTHSRIEVLGLSTK